jgi:hypothetical protein
MIPLVETEGEIAKKCSGSGKQNVLQVIVNF